MGKKKTLKMPFDFYNQSSKSQFRSLLKTSQFIGPNYFINRYTLTFLKGFDERFPMSEDYPLTVKVTQNGYKINLINKVLVTYRINSNSITRSIHNELFLRSFDNFKKIVIYPLYKDEGMLLHFWHWKLNYYFESHKNSGIMKYIFVRYAIRIFDPLSWQMKLLKYLKKVVFVTKKLNNSLD